MDNELLSFDVAALLKEKKISEFTEIQRLAIPKITSGDNVLVIAPTGSGKTETAMLPILSKIANKKKAAAERGEKLKGIKAIYITPLRALNRDILERFTSWCKQLEITIAVRHGDTTATERVKQRDEPPLFMITTPETLQSLLIAPKLSDALINVEHLVIDEVHELYDSKRGAQLALGLERLEAKAPGFQRIGLSATVGSPEKVARFIGQNVKICNTEAKRKLELSVELVRRPRGTESAKLRTLLNIPAATVARLQRIEELIHQHNSTLVFVNTRYAAESLANGLYAMESMKDKISVHHSSLSKEVRMDTERKFKDQQVKAIVCTSSLELGIDIGTVDLVIQYASPRHVTRLVQRVGRSGHKHYLQPKGIILATDEMDMAEAAAVCSQAERGQLEEMEHPFNALDVLGHFLAGIAYEYNTIQLSRVLEMCHKTFTYSTLTEQQLLATAKQMANNGIIKLVEEKSEQKLGQGAKQNEEICIQTRGMRTKLYYYENISTIPDQKRYFIKDSATRKNVAVLDEAFVSEFIETGGIFIAQGKAWKVLSIDKQEIIVEAAADLTAAVPDWLGEEIPVTRQTAKLVAEILSAQSDANNQVEDNRNQLLKFCSTSDRKQINEFAAEQEKTFTPTSDIVVEENVSENFLVLHSFHGLRANETLARVLSVMLAQRDKSLKTRASPYSIILEFSRPVSGEEVVEVVQNLNPGLVQRTLEESLPTTRLFRHKFVHVAKRFGFIKKDWDASASSLGRIIATIDRNNPMIRETLAELLSSRLSLEEAKTVAGEISKSAIKVKRIYTKKWSPLAQNALEFGGASELFLPAEPTSAIVEAFAQTMRAKSVRLNCTYCKNTFTFDLVEIKADEKITCPHCSSTQLTLAEYMEKEQPRETEKATSLISAYGGRALFALETYGVGPQTAGRVLARMHKTEEEFFKDLLEAQKNFLKTRKFWKI